MEGGYILRKRALGVKDLIGEGMSSSFQDESSKTRGHLKPDLHTGGAQKKIVLPQDERFHAGDQLSRRFTALRQCWLCVAYFVI